MRGLIAWSKKMTYAEGWCTIDELNEALSIGLITQDEYDLIVK